MLTIQTRLHGLHVGAIPLEENYTDVQSEDTTSTRLPMYVLKSACTRFADTQATMGTRLPTILGKAIDDVWKTLNQESEEERIVDLVNCIHRMEDLMGDLQGNSKLRPIIDDGAGDIALWNKVSHTLRLD